MAESKIENPNGNCIRADLLSSGFTSQLSKNGLCYVIRSHNVCTLVLDIKSTVSGSASPTGVLIPEGYRPKNYQPVFMMGDGSSTGQSIGKIDSSGILSGIWIGSTKYIQGLCTYLIY